MINMMIKYENLDWNVLGLKRLTERDKRAMLVTENVKVEGNKARVCPLYCACNTVQYKSYMAYFTIGEHTVTFKSFVELEHFFNEFISVLNLKATSATSKNAYVVVWTPKTKKLYNDFVQHNLTVTSTLLDYEFIYQNLVFRCVDAILPMTTLDEYFKTDLKEEPHLLYLFSKYIIDTFLVSEGYIPFTSTSVFSHNLKKKAVKYADEILPKHILDDCKGNKGELQPSKVLDRISTQLFYSFDGTHTFGADYRDFTAETCEEEVPINGIKVAGYNYHNYFKYLVRGGWCFINNCDIGNELTDVAGYDFSGSYAFSQLTSYFPCSKFWEVSKMYYSEILENCKDFNYITNERKYCYIMTVELTNVMCKYDLPLIHANRCEVEGNSDIVYDQVLSADKITICLTDADLCTLYKMYDFDINVLEMRRALAKKLPKYVIEQIMECADDKYRLKGVEGKEVDYVLAKLNVEYSYGKCIQQIFPREGEDIEEATFRQLRKRVLSPYWGIFTASYSKLNLVQIVHQILENSDGEDVIYGDTDSAYFLNLSKHKHIIEEWNVYALNKMREVIGDRYPRILKLGQFCNIAEEDSNGKCNTYIRFKVIGKKHYVKEIKVNTVIKVLPTCAGLPKKIIQNVANVNGLDLFDDFNEVVATCEQELYFMLG